MTKLFSMYFLLAFLVACSPRNQKSNKQDTDQSIAQSIAQSDVIQFRQSLLNAYKDFNIEYINNIYCIGEGVVNPRNFNLKLILDTAAMTSLEIPNIEEQQYVIPIINKPSYKVFYMPVIEVGNQFYKVKINKEQFAYLHKEECDYYSWQTFFIEQTLCVESEVVYSHPNLNSKKMNLKGESLIVKKVKNDWIGVEIEQDDEKKTERILYWINWTDNESLFIFPILLM